MASRYYPLFYRENPVGIISVEDAEKMIVVEGRAEFATEEGETVVRVRIFPAPEAERIIVPLSCAPEGARATILRYLPPDWAAWDSLQAWVGDSCVFFVGKKDGKSVQIFMSGRSGDAVRDTMAEGKKQGRTRIFYAIKSKGAEC